MEFGQLWAMLAGEAWHRDKFALEDITPDAEADAWLCRFPTPFVERLAGLDDAAVPALARSLGELDELSHVSAGRPAAAAGRAAPCRQRGQRRRGRARALLVGIAVSLVIRRLLETDAATFRTLRLAALVDTPACFASSFAEEAVTAVGADGRASRVASRRRRVRRVRGE